MKNNYSTYSDEELLPLLSGRKKEVEAAFTELYNRYSAKVHAYCRYMIYDSQAAEDIFQDTFVRFYNNIGSLSLKSNVIGYLMTIARNLCLNYLRGKKTNVPIESVHYLKSDYYSFEQSEIFDLIIKTLDLLDERYKEAFILREFDGLQYQEIADITGTTLTNAKSRVKRAREKMMEIMEPYIKDEI